MMETEAWLPEPPAHLLRIGIIGLGGIARSSHLPALAALRRQGWPVTIVAVAEPSAASLEAARAVAPFLFETARVFTEGAALLEAAPDLGCDAVLLLTPPEATPSLLQSALALPCAIFVEKPVAEESETLAELAEATRRWDAPLVLVGYNRRWQPRAPTFREAIQRFRTEGISAPLHAEARLWRTLRSEDIFYRDTMIHAVDFLLWCFGPLEVKRVSLWPPAQPGGIWAGLRAELAAADATTVHLDVRPAVGRTRESYEAFGYGGCAELCYPAAGSTRREAEMAHLQIWGRRDTPEMVWAQSPAPGIDPLVWKCGFLGQMAAFITLADQAAGERVTSPCGLPEALAARRLTDELLARATE